MKSPHVAFKNTTLFIPVVMLLQVNHKTILFPHHEIFAKALRLLFLVRLERIHNKYILERKYGGQSFTKTHRWGVICTWGPRCVREIQELAERENWSFRYRTTNLFSLLILNTNRFCSYNNLENLQLDIFRITEDNAALRLELDEFRKTGSSKLDSENILFPSI